MGNIFQELYYCRRENGDSRNAGARLWLGGWPIASSIRPQKTAISFPLYRKIFNLDSLTRARWVICDKNTLQIIKSLKYIYISEKWYMFIRN